MPVSEFYDIIISTDKSLLDLDAVCGFLSRSYWAQNRPRETILRSVENSMCFGAYIGEKQVGFARVVTDGVTMYYLCDVFIDEAYRGQGIGKKLVARITTCDELRNLTGWLGTADAHGLYESYHFEREPERVMRRRPDYVRSHE